MKTIILLLLMITVCNAYEPAKERIFYPINQKDLNKFLRVFKDHSIIRFCNWEGPNYPDIDLSTTYTEYDMCCEPWEKQYEACPIGE